MAVILNACFTDKHNTKLFFLVTSAISNIIFPYFSTPVTSFISFVLSIVFSY